MTNPRLTQANKERSVEAAKRQASIANQAGYERLLQEAAHAAFVYGSDSRLHKGLVRQCRAVKLRADNPKASLPDLAAKAGMTKDMYAKLLSRGMEAIEASMRKERFKK